MANNGLNEVIVVSPVLEEYIRINYPEYKLTSSSCKGNGTVEALLGELEKDYSMVSADSCLNNRFELLEQIPAAERDRVEFLTNPCCIPNCPYRSAHYYSIGLQQIAYNEHIKKYPSLPFDLDKHDPSRFRDCPCPQRDLFEIKGLRTHISPEDIWEKYVPMGFEHFEIEGRNTSPINVFETYMYYMIEPEYRDEARFTLLRSMESKGALIFK